MKKIYSFKLAFLLFIVLLGSLTSCENNSDGVSGFENLENAEVVETKLIDEIHSTEEININIATEPEQKA